MKRFPLLPLCVAGLLLGGQLFAATMSADPNDVWKNVKKPTTADMWPAPPPELDISAYRVTTGKGKGHVTASDQGFPNEGPENLFDKEKKFCVKARTAWVQYQYKDNGKQKATAYVITAAGDAAERDPKSWKLLGSTDGQTWDILDEQANQDFAERDMARLFKVAKPGSYNAYRLEVTANHGDDCIQFAQLKLLGDKSQASKDDQKKEPKKTKPKQ